MSTITPDMSLPVPSVGDSPPTWGTQQADAMFKIDAHDHTPGKGITVPTAGLNINEPLSFQNNFAVNVKGVGFEAQSDDSIVDRSMFAKVDGELYYRDGSGNIVKITNHGVVNGAGGGGSGINYFLTATDVATLRLATQIQPYQVYKTLSYGSSFGVGGAFYLWDPTNVNPDDGALTIRPSAYVVGAFIYLPQDGESFDLMCAPFDFTGQTDEAPRLLAIMLACANRGLTTVIGHDGDLDIRTYKTLVDASTTYKGLNINFKGRGQTKSRFRARVGYEALITNPVRLTANSALPACTAAGAGVGKTLTMNAVGGLGVDNLSLGTIASTGASSITLSIVANAGLVAPGDVVQPGTSPNAVGGSVVLNSNPGTGVINFTVPHGGQFVPGGGAWKGKVCINGDRILVAGQANAADNGIYTYATAAPFAILTRATDFNTSTALKALLGVRTTDGNANLGLAYVLSNKPGEFWDDTAMTIDVSPQYWSSEPFVAGAFAFTPVFEVSPYRGSQPTLSPQHFIQWTHAADGTCSPVNFLAGGSFTDPDTGLTTVCKAVAPGDEWFIKQGGTPTDQGWYFDGYRARVMSVDQTSRTVIIDKGAYLTSYTIRAAITQGLAAAGANQYTCATKNNAALAPAGYTMIASGRAGFGLITGNNPTTGVVTVQAGTLPVGMGPSDEVFIMKDAPVSRGNITAVGANSVTLGTPANAGLYAINDRLYIPTRVGFGIVTARDATTGVVTVAPGTLPAGATIGDTAYQIAWFPSYNENKSRWEIHNEYHRIIRDCRDIEWSGFSCKGVSIWLDFCENINFHDFTLSNVHIGINASGTTGDVHDYRIRNQNGLNFAGITSPVDPLRWYGWTHQSNYNPRLRFYRMHGDGISGDWADQEAETETLWSDVRVSLRPSPVSHNSQFVGGTTPNVSSKHNPITNMIIDGGTGPATLVLADPVHGLSFRATEPVSNWPGVALNLNTTSGVLEFKGRRYDLGFRRHWSVRITLTAAMTKTVKRPFKGLWSNTRIRLSTPTMTGITGLIIGPDLVTSTDILTIAQGNFVSGGWFYPGSDEMLGAYPNAGDSVQQTLTITTDGTFPAGAQSLWLETDVIPEVSRGDNYSGVSAGFDAKLYGQYTDASFPPIQYAVGAPAAAPNFPGEYYISTAGNIWIAIDVTAAGDWKQIA